MDDERHPTAEIQVAGAQPPDVGKGTARINRQVLERLGTREGAVLEVIGKRTTAVIVLPPYPQDEGVDIIRLDGMQRANIGVGIGDRVQVRVAEVQPAEKVALAPAQKNILLRGSGQALLRTLNGRPLVQGDVVSTSVYRRTNDMDDGPFPEDVFRNFFQQRAFGLQEIRLVVTRTKPRGVVRVTPETEIELLPQHVEPEEPRATGVTYDDVGGLGATIEQVREMIELPLKHPELFQRLGIDPPKGVLLYGPPGTGKTLLARAVAAESEAAFFDVAGPEIMGKYHGESEERLREIFQKAQEEAPAIVFIDEIDSIAPKRDQTTGEVERRVVAQLLALMDGLAPRQNVVVIGATNRLDSLDEALRRPGRFDREIIIGVPDLQGRREILGIHTRGMPLTEQVDLEEIGRMTYGFVGADLAALCREAAIESLRRILPTINLDEPEIPQELLEQLEVGRDDFVDALHRVQPSALREIMIQVPDVGWDDIGGLDQVKQELRENIQWPLRNPEAFRKLGIRPAKGFLLFGPPGTGKTLLARAVARESDANFVATKSSDLLSKWYGESEKQIARLFQRARQVAPTVIFIDEIDSLAPRRGGSLGEPAVTERVVNTLLGEMDGLEELQGVVVVGATNRPNLLDPALLRPGRFDELFYVPVPGRAGRRKILQIHTGRMALAADVDLDSLADRTDGYTGADLENLARRTDGNTGADLENLARRAGLLALRAQRDAIAMEFFEQALTETRASVPRELEEEYRRLSERLKRESPRGPRRIGFAIERGPEAEPAAETAAEPAPVQEAEGWRRPAERAGYDEGAGRDEARP